MNNEEDEITIETEINDRINLISKAKENICTLQNEIFREMRLICAAESQLNTLKRLKKQGKDIQFFYKMRKTDVIGGN